MGKYDPILYCCWAGVAVNRDVTGRCDIPPRDHYKKTSLLVLYYAFLKKIFRCNYSASKVYASKDINNILHLVLALEIHVLQKYIVITVYCRSLNINKYLFTSIH